MTKSIISSLCRTSIGVIAAFSALSAQAQTVIYDFEPPTFTTGNVVGQGGFAGTNNVWNVSDTFVPSGSTQALRASSTNTGAVNFTPNFSPAPNLVFASPGADIVRVSFDYGVTSRPAGNANNTYASMRFGTSTNTDSAAMMTLSFREDGRIVASVGTSAGSGVASPTLVGQASVANNQFYHISMDFNFADGTILFSFDNTPYTATNLFFRSTAPTSMVSSMQVNNVSFANGLTIDNLTYTVIPEPSTMGLMLVGMLGIVAMARRARARPHVPQIR
jgi:hypothetical protein